MLIPLKPGELQRLIPAVATGNQFRASLGTPQQVLQRLMLIHFGRVEALAELIDQLGGFDGGATERIPLAVVVQFGELSVVVKACCCCSGLLQQDHADGKIWNHGASDGGLGSELTKIT